MQDAINFLNQDYYLNYPLIYALEHGAELIGANQHGVALLFPDPDFLLLAGTNPLELVKNRAKPDLVLICGSQNATAVAAHFGICLLYTSPSPRDRTRSRMPSSA